MELHDHSPILEIVSILSGKNHHIFAVPHLDVYEMRANPSTIPAYAQHYQFDLVMITQETQHPNVKWCYVDQFQASSEHACTCNTRPSSVRKVSFVSLRAVVYSADPHDVGIREWSGSDDQNGAMGVSGNRFTAGS